LLVLVSGDSQMALAGAELSQALTIGVRTGVGVGLAGVPVVWSAGAGSGSLSTGLDTTDTDGNSSVVWRLGTTLGVQTADARVEGIQGSPVSFTATSLAGLELIAGDSQVGEVGTALPELLVVRARAETGEALSGVPVSWAIESGGGGLSAGLDTSDVDGLSSVRWTLGSTVGAQSASASAGQGTGQSVTFSASGSSSAASTLSLQSGDGQTATVGSALSAPLVVRVSDGSGGGLPGVSVAWTVVTGGGSLSAPVTQTDASGLASVDWTLGSTAGTQTAVATVSGLAGSPVTFTATATSAGAASLSLVSGNGQSSTVGTAVAQPLVVVVRDGGGSPVPGTPVTWEVTDGGGTLSGGVVVTDGSGRSSVTWTLGDRVGTQGAQASVSGLAGSPVLFTATGIAPGAGATYYLSTSGSNGADGLSGATAWQTFSYALDRVSAGDVLIVLDGTYTQALVTSRSGVSGNPIVIRAEHDGGAIIDGGWSRVPIQINHDFIQVEGFTARRGDVSNILISGSNNKVLRVGAMSVTSSVYAWNIGVGGTNNLLEDVFVWGGFRSAIEVYSSGNTIRRCVIKMDAMVDAGNTRYPNGVRFYKYEGYAGGLVENCIVLDWAVTMDYYFASGGAFKIRSYRRDDPSRFYGNIALDINSNQGSISGWRLEGQDHVLENCVAWNGDNYGFINTGPNSTPNSVTATNVTGYNWGDGVIGPDFSTPINFVNEKLDNSGMTYLTRPDGSGRGATIENRYVDGVLTSEPLWPWPGEDRIRNEICQYEISGSGYFTAGNPNRGFCASGKTLTRYIWEYLGTPCPASVCY
jgi:hypothetical protein